MFEIFLKKKLESNSKCLGTLIYRKSWNSYKHSLWGAFQQSTANAFASSPLMLLLISSWTKFFIHLIHPSSSPFLPTVPSTWNALPLQRVHPWPLPPTNSFSGTNNTSSVMIPSLTPGSKSVFSSCCKHQFSPSCYYLYISICKFPSRLSYWMWRTCFISFISIYFSCIHFSVFISWWWGPQYLGTVNKCCIWMNILYYF